MAANDENRPRQYSIPTVIYGKDGRGFTWKGAYASNVTYLPYDAVVYNAATYVCLQQSTGNAPSNSSFWSVALSNGVTAATGDVAFSGTGSVVATLATVNSNVGTWSDASHTPQLVVNAKGLVTGVSNISIAIDASALISGTLPAGRFPALTGDLTTSAGALATTLVNIPTGVTAAGTILHTNIAAPSTPAAGKVVVYTDSTSKNFAAKNDAGIVNHGIQTKTAVAHQFLTSIADDGSSVLAQPTFADISGSLWTKTPGAVAFIDATGHLVDADDTNLFWDNLNKRLLVGIGGAYTPAAGPPVTVSSAGNLGGFTNVAVGLDKAATQTILKANGAFNVGTSGSNNMNLIANGAFAMTISGSTQELTFFTGLTSWGLQASPATPSVGSARCYIDSTSLALASKNSSGAVASTAFTIAPVASNWLRSFDSSTGQFTASRPAFADISGTLAGTQFGPLTGDVTTSSYVSTLATVNSNVGSFGDASHAVSFTLNGKGLVTAASSAPISIAAGAVSGLAAIATSGSAADLTTGILPAARFGTLTGDIGNGGGFSYATTLNNIPNDVPMAGDLLATTIVAPVTPSAGKARLYVDSTSKNFAVKSDAGVVNHGIQTKAAVSHQFLTSVADDGSSVLAQPGFSDISGTLAGTQFGPLTGDITTSSYASTLATVNSNVGSFGGAASVGTFTVNGKGLITAAGSTAIAIAAGAVSGLATVATSGSATDLTSGTLPVGRLPAFTGGDVTTSAGSGVTTLLNISNGVTMTGDILVTSVVAPSSPAAGKLFIYGDSTSKNFCSKDDAGNVNHGVRSITPPANNFIFAISDNGVVSAAQPSFSGISGVITAGQLPAFTGDVTKPLGSTVQTLANIPNDVPAAGDIQFTEIAAPAAPSAGSLRVWADSTTHALRGRSSANLCTMAFQYVSPANQFLTAFDGTFGTFNSAQPTFGNISGTLGFSQGGTGQTSAGAAFDALGSSSASIAAATTTDLSTVSGGYVLLTGAGAVNITSFGTVTNGRRVTLRNTTASSVGFTHNSTSLLCPGGAQGILLDIGDSAEIISLGGGNWQVLSVNNVSVWMGKATTTAVGLQTGGTVLMQVSGTTLVFNASILANAGGGNTTPSYSFNADTGTGMWRIGAGDIGFASATTQQFHVNANGLQHNTRHQQGKGATVASAATITLGNDGNVFVLSGTTPVTAITTTGWQSGSIIVLIPNSASITLGHSASAGGIKTKTGSPVVPVLGSPYMLVYDGSTWSLF